MVAGLRWSEWDLFLKPERVLQAPENLWMMRTGKKVKKRLRGRMPGAQK
jgi:hypothetical protein